jgi:hypothetical protein
MGVVIDYEFLTGLGDDTIVKELSIAGHGVFNTFLFQSPYAMHPHGSAENGRSWDDGHIPYNQLYTVLSEAVAGYAHVYSYGAAKCKVISELIGRPILDLVDLGCPPTTFTPAIICGMSCHKFHNLICATRNAQSLYQWLMYHLQTKAYVRFPMEMVRQTDKFLSAV